MYNRYFGVAMDLSATVVAAAILYEAYIQIGWLAVFESAGALGMMAFFHFHAKWKS